MWPAFGYLVVGAQDANHASTVLADDVGGDLDAPGLVGQVHSELDAAAGYASRGNEHAKNVAL